MLKRFLSIAAVVLVANAGALALVVQNGRGVPDAVLQLSERELRVTNMGTDTTGMTLTLQWDRNAVVPWFDRAKLESIGFDCSIPPNAPDAARHYSPPSMLPRATYAVFEYDSTKRAGDPSAPVAPPEFKAAAPSSPSQPESANTAEYRSRLIPVDVGNDPEALRRKYADRHRDLITAASVRARLVAATADRPARLEGVILWVDPSQVYVPQQMQATIGGLLGKAGNQQSTLALLTHPPRYQVTVEYGSRWLPRVVAVRPLP